MGVGGMCSFADKKKMGINYLVAQGPEFDYSLLFDTLYCASGNIWRVE